MTTQTVPADLVMPEAVNDGRRVPTLNQYGWMVTGVIDPVDQYIKLASKSKHWALEIGSAYGSHTIAALEAGARVVALDLDERHLQILKSRVGSKYLPNLQTVHGAFPQVDLPSNSYEAILACRVLHFLDGPTLLEAARKTFDLLVPGGKVFVRCLSVYTQITANFIPEYEQRKAAGDPWPGYIAEPRKYVTDETELAHMGPIPLHCLEPAHLARAFAEAGFTIERAEFCSIALDFVKMDGRESTIVVASKPLT